MAHAAIHRPPDHRRRGRGHQHYSREAKMRYLLLLLLSGCTALPSVKSCEEFTVSYVRKGMMYDEVQTAKNCRVQVSEPIQVRP